MTTQLATFPGNPAILHNKKSWKLKLITCVINKLINIIVLFTPFSEFQPQLSAIMTVANCFVDLIDIQGSSVLVCFEDGWDATAQVTYYSLVHQTLYPMLWGSEPCPFSVMSVQCS